MNFPSWSEAYAIGIPLLDQQHAVMFSAIHSICEAHDREGAREGLKAPFDFLKDYTRLHFKTEERLMERLGFPDLQHHRKSHHHLFDEVTRLVFRSQTHGVVIHTDVLPLLQTWLLGHILEEDRAFAEFYRQVDADGNLDLTGFDPTLL